MMASDSATLLDFAGYWLVLWAAGLVLLRTVLQTIAVMSAFVLLLPQIRMRLEEGTLLMSFYGFRLATGETESRASTSPRSRREIDKPPPDQRLPPTTAVDAGPLWRHPPFSGQGARRFEPKRGILLAAPNGVHWTAACYAEPVLADLEPPYVVIKPGVREEEFYALAGEDSDWEYLDGRLVMSPASLRHEELFRFLLNLLGGFLDERGGAKVFGSRYPMRLDERWSPEPDLLVVRDERRHLLKPQRLDGPADWVIEIVSEGDPEFERREKLPRYRQAGIPEIWLVDPFRREVRVERLTSGDYETVAASSGKLESTVVPGFWIDASWLWQEDLPSSIACLRQILGEL